MVDVSGVVCLIGKYSIGEKGQKPGNGKDHEGKRIATGPRPPFLRRVGKNPGRCIVIIRVKFKTVATYRHFDLAQNPRSDISSHRLKPQVVPTLDF
ncbi:MAG: hypothetical protein GY945_04285 [Rhodobacteraceae bacterium]|nr:hypothetical protein [Paracoccaceae bacterium]